MKSYEALQRAIHGKSVDVARKLGVSTSLINKWQEPCTDWSDSGAYNPLDRLETVIEHGLAIGLNPEDALAPIRYLAERFGLILIPVPSSASSVNQVSQDLLKTIKEFGELAQTASNALLDGSITRRELSLIQKEAWDLIRQTAEFLKKAEDAAQ